MRIVTHKEFIETPDSPGDETNTGTEVVIIWPSEAIGLAFGQADLVKAIAVLKTDGGFYQLTIRKLEEALGKLDALDDKAVRKGRVKP